MAIEFHEEKSGGIIDVHLSGILFREDYRSFLPDLARLIATHGRVRLLVTMQSFYGWAAGVLWEEIKCDPKLFRQVERVAVIGDPRWKHALSLFCTPFMRATTRYFYRDQAADAQAWIHQELPTAT